MKKLLHIVATPRGDESRTLKVSSAFLASLITRYPDLDVHEINVATEELPALTLKVVSGK